MNPTIKARIESIRRGEVPEGYKRTKIGIVPNEWGNVLFSTLFESFSVYTEDLEKYPLYSLTIEEGITPKTERYERSFLVKKKNAYKVMRPNDFAYNPMNLRFGAVARYKGEKLISVSGYYDIFTTKSKLDLEFMDNFLIFDNMITYYNKVSIGSLIEKQRVHFSNFLNFELPLPPLTERNRIAEILAGQDRVIALKEKLLAEKQKQKKYFMQQLLTGKKRLPGFSGEWKEGELGDMVLECNDGSTPSRKNDDFFNGDINWVVVEDIRPYIYSTKEKLSKKGVESANLKVWKRGTVIISTCASIGLVGILCCEAATKQGITAILVNEDNSNEYVRFWLENEKSALLKFAQGSSIREIRSPILLKLKINYPCMQEQNAIVKILLMADKEIELLKKDIEQEKLKKKSLMQLLLTGIVRVDELTA